MEDRDVSLSDDDVRERFSAFHDGELAPDEARQVRERIEGDPALRAEFDAFKRVMGGLAVLAAHGAHGSPDGGAQPKASVDPAVAALLKAASADASGPQSTVPAAKAAPDESPVLPEDEEVDLLPNLQATIHKRSGGKFYKTRASRVVGTRPIEAIAAVTLVLLVLLWALSTFVSGLRPADGPAPPPPVVTPAPPS